MKTRYVTILVTCPSAEEAAKISEALLKKRLVACANMLNGIESSYWWEGRIERSKETLLVLKSVSGKFAKIEEAVKKLHSYEVPEIIALPVDRGQKSYLKWIDESIKS